MAAAAAVWVGGEGPLRVCVCFLEGWCDAHTNQEDVYGHSGSCELYLIAPGCIELGAC